MRKSMTSAFVAISAMLAILSMPTAAIAAPPANDSFASARSLEGGAATIAGTTADATSEAGEPCTFGCSPSVWYRWTSPLPVTTIVTFSLCGSSYDTTLGVFQGDTLATLVSINQNDDDAGCPPASSASFMSIPGRVYSIRVGGAGGASGAFTLAYPAGGNVPGDDDVTAPLLDVPVLVQAQATSSAGAVVSWTTSATDDRDGDVPVTCAPAAGDVFPLGMTLVGCSAWDAAGNVTTKSFPVFVTYAWSGVLAPLNADGSSIYKGKAVIPVKFRLTGYSAAITDAVARISLVRVSGTVVGTEPEVLVKLVATTGDEFRYDAATGTYVYNLSTKGLARGTYRIRIDLGDGVQRAVDVSLR